MKNPFYAMPEKEYYIIDNRNQQSGPYTFKELKKMRLRPHTQVWEKGPGSWQYAQNIKGLVRKDLRHYQGVFEMILFAVLVGLVATVIYFS